MDEQAHSISNSTAAFMIIIAVIIDVAQFFIEIIGLVVIGAIINIGVDIFAGGTFYLWFKMRGVSFNSPKKMTTLGLGVLIELLPIIQMLPAWTFVVVRTIALTRAEEKLAAVAPVVAKISQIRRS